MLAARRAALSQRRLEPLLPAAGAGCEQRAPVAVPGVELWCRTPTRLRVQLARTTTMWPWFTFALITDCLVVAYLIKARELTFRAQTLARLPRHSRAGT